MTTGGYRGLEWVTGLTRSDRGFQRGYRELERVTRGNKRLRRVARAYGRSTGYRGFQGLLGGNNGLQRVTEGYKG